ncbi:MAG TPA: TonB-dependent receptor [Gemmatimonadales bacterium]|nr:TonB-dependent receptor [Gemmatimonadales bacterium]
MRLRKPHARGLLLIAFFGLVPGLASAQGVTGRIEGIITDNTGSVLPGATVTATHQGTNAVKSSVTSAHGGYVVTPLVAGPYRIRVEMSGFRPATAALTLAVNQVARMDFRLELGGLTEAVEVTGAAPLIEKSTSSLGVVIDTKQLETLPLNGRNFTQLATLSPGVNRGAPGGNADGSRGNTETFRYGEVGGGALSVNGMREQQNSFLLDGIDNNETLVNTVIFFPSVEALQEFRVITGNAPAEFGRSGGAVTNLVTKSGTNEFHGSLYEFHRNEALDARPTFAQRKLDFSRNQFGATTGGPLVKNRTFFFASYAGLRQHLPVEPGNLVAVPTARMRRGDFSELLDPSFTGVGAPIIVHDPLTGQPFPGNVIPEGRLDPVAVRYLNAFPLPTVAGRAQRNYLTQRVRDQRFNDADLRLDHRFGTSDTLFLRGSYARDRQTDPGRIPGYQAGFGSGTAEAVGWGAALGQTHVFGPRLVNELRAGYTNYRYAFLPVNFGIDQNREIGIPGPGGITLDNGISLIGASGTYLEFLGDSGQYIVRQKLYQVSDALTWVRGAHTFKAGGSAIRRDMQFERMNAGKGSYRFSTFVATPGRTPPPGQTGFEIAEVLVGRTDMTETGIPGFVPRSPVSWEHSLFLQDDWRLSRTLTLNLGLRYDVFVPYYEKDDQLANFDPATRRMVLAGQGGASRSTVDTDWNNFGPRLGFARQLGAKTVVRGAYGIFYMLERGGIGNQLTENPPFQRSQVRDRATPGGSVRLSEPIPLPDAFDPNNPGRLRVVYVPRDNPTSRVQQFNLGAQRDLGFSTALTVAYVGTRGDNIIAVSRSRDAVAGGDRVAVRNTATSSYDSLQVTLRRQARGGLSYLAAYTWGHAINDSPGPLPGEAARLADTPTDARNLGLDKGDADFDVRHRFTLASTYELPFGKGTALGGWSLNAILVLSTGIPFSVTTATLRADVSGDPNDGPKTTDKWFNTSAFSVPPAGATRGNSGRNIVRAPGIRTLDLSLFKTFNTMRRTRLDIRIEAFNVFNTPQYGAPRQRIDQVDFGRITTTRLNSERQIQLGARFAF